MNDSSPHGVDFDIAIDDTARMLCSIMHASSVLSIFKLVLSILQGKMVRIRM